MMQLPIQQLPNQALSIVLDNNQWDFLIKTVQDVTVISLRLNEVGVVNSAHAASGALIIPTQYEEQGAGNFFFVTQNLQLPYYTMFTVTQFLIYVSGAELAVFRTPLPPKIVAADFNPIAALPLRFAPQGYMEA